MIDNSSNWPIVHFSYNLNYTKMPSLRYFGNNTVPSKLSFYCAISMIRLFNDNLLSLILVWFANIVLFRLSFVNLGFDILKILFLSFLFIQTNKLFYINFFSWKSHK